MNREIKFRGKSIFGIHEWLYGSLLLLNGKSYICPDKAAAWNMTRYEVIPNTVGQFTGLFDKNGKEIYEGDIISVNGKYPKLVKYINDYACFCLANIKDLDEEMDTGYWHQVSPGWWNSSKREIQVIGNIYDNPELIKEE